MRCSRNRTCCVRQLPPPDEFLGLVHLRSCCSELWDAHTQPMLCTNISIWIRLCSPHSSIPQTVKSWMESWRQALFWLMQWQILPVGMGQFKLTVLCPKELPVKIHFQSPSPNNQSYGKQVSYWSRAHCAT